MTRILVTGSRDWDDADTIYRAFYNYLNEDDIDQSTTVLVSGACPSGADALAESLFKSWGIAVERHPAEWDVFGKKAGMIRNQEMVDLGADVCIAFIKNSSPGASHAALMAKLAGIQTIIYRDE